MLTGRRKTPQDRNRLPAFITAEDSPVVAAVDSGSATKRQPEASP